MLVVIGSPDRPCRRRPGRRRARVVRRDRQAAGGGRRGDRTADRRGEARPPTRSGARRRSRRARRRSSCGRTWSASSANVAPKTIKAEERAGGARRAESRGRPETLEAQEGDSAAARRREGAPGGAEGGEGRAARRARADRRGLSVADAKREMMERAEELVRREMARWCARSRRRRRRTRSGGRANLVADALQRVAASHAAETTVSASSSCRPTT